MANGITTRARPATRSLVPSPQQGSRWWADSREQSSDSGAEQLAPQRFRLEFSAQRLVIDRF